MSQSESGRAVSAQAGDSRWRSLYRIDAVAAVISYVPEVGVWISMLSVVGYLIWYILIARKLFRLGWGGLQKGST